MFRRASAVLTLCAFLASPAAVFAAEPGAAPAAATGQADAKAAAKRVAEISREIKNLRRKIGRLTAPRYEYEYRGGGAPSDYRSAVITSGNGLAGYAARDSMTGPMLDKIETYRRQIALLLEEQRALTASRAL